MQITPACQFVLRLSAAGLALTGAGHAAAGTLASPSRPMLGTPLPGEAPAETALAWGDVDGDGLQDALAIGARGEIRLLLNLGEGRFEDVTEVSGLSVLSGASCVLFSDLDGDDRPDLFLGSSEQRVWRNMGDGTFQAVAACIEHDLVDLGAQAVDQDGDGHIDLQVHTEAGDLVYRNLGEGRFELVKLPVPMGLAGAGATGVGPMLNRERATANAPAAIDRLESTGRASLAEQRLARWSTSIALGSSSSVMGVPGAAGSALEFCLPGIRDAAGADCIGASSDPELGKLYPLGMDFMIAPTGDVGIGTLAPDARLHVANPSGTAGLRLDGSFAFAFMERASSGQDSMIRFQTGGADQWVMGMDNVPSSNSNDFTIKRSQNSAPDLYIDEGSGEITVRHDMEMSSDQGDLEFAIRADTDNNNESDHARLLLEQDGGQTRSYIGYAAGENSLKIVTESSDDIILLAGNNGGPGEYDIKIDDSSGLVSVKQSLEIRGGADIVERFESSCGTLEPGTVVSIDPEHAGALACSAEAYDTKVAGVVSGAGGVNPGICLGQEGVLDGEMPVAMTGRVYVKCSTENGAIQPGDRLTTANLAGYAMKVTDKDLADGAVIGKAMSSLDEETGLVLVLVNLQ